MDVVVGWIAWLASVVDGTFVLRDVRNDERRRQAADDEDTDEQVASEEASQAP